MLMNIIPEGCEGEETPEGFLTLVCVPWSRPCQQALISVSQTEWLNNRGVVTQDPNEYVGQCIPVWWDTLKCRHRDMCS